MRAGLVLLVPFAVACGPTADKPAASADSAPAAAPAAAAAPAGPRAIVTVIYLPPKDTAAFEKYYRDVHLPLVSAGQGEIGFTSAELTRFTSTLDGKAPTFYRQAELYFGSMDDLKRGTATPAFKKVGDDLANFATGGLIGMIATETGSESGEPCPALVTVIYEHPKDHDAFEKYYADTHLPLVTAGQGEIGFQRADLTKFDSNLDGSPAAKYRQAELCFPSSDAVKKGTATPAFKKVGDDLGNFASGGLTALIGVQQ